MFALLVAAAMAAQDAPPEPKPLSVEESHDRVRDESKSVLTIGRVYTAPEAWNLKADLSFEYGWSGVQRAALKPADPVQVVVVGVAKSPAFDGKRDLAMLAGDVRVRSEGGEYEAGTFLDYIEQRGVRSADGGALTLGNVIPTVETVAVRRWRETVTWTLPFGDFQRLTASQADHVDLSVGDQAWKLDRPQVDAIRRWTARLAVSSEEARRAEEAFEKAQAEAKAARDTRLAPYKADVQAAVEKALKAKRSVPKKQYATIGEKLKWRTFDREMEAVVRKHRLKPEDLEALLADYPDFRVRNKIN